MPCPLCIGNTAFFFEDERRAYQQCKKCALIFVPAEFHLMRAEEKAQYDLHENNPKDSDYRQFLSRLSDPLIRKLSPNSSGLDFGCGSGPTLSVILEEAGHQVALYDPFYQPDPTTLKATYDFITATEVLEHLFHPRCCILNRQFSPRVNPHSEALIGPTLTRHAPLCQYPLKLIWLHVKYANRTRRLPYL